LHIKIHADKNVDFRIIKEIRGLGIPILSVLENFQGANDKEILNLSRRENAILLTEDSDFGEWVFAYKELNVGVIFIRYKKHEVEEIAEKIIKLINIYKSELFNKFVVITTKKIRIREL